RQAATVALVKPGRGSWPYHAKNSSNPRFHSIGAATQLQKKPPTLAGSGLVAGARRKALIFGLIQAVARHVARGLRSLDLALGGSREEPAHAVGLPIRVLHDLGQRRALGPSDQLQDLRALALRARGAGFLGGGFGRPLAGLGILFRARPLPGSRSTPSA